MDEIEDLRAELAQLRDSTRTLLAIVTACLASTRNSADALKEISARISEAEQHRPRGDEFWEAATVILRMLSSAAVTQHPADPEVLRIHHGVRAEPH